MKRHLHPRCKRLLELLSDGSFHTGTELGAILETSRTTISKYVRQIQNLGLDVYVVKGKGYSLPNTVELLDEKRINDAVGGAQASCFDIIDSTNSYMMSYLDRFVPGSCVLAEAQTMGIGRGNTTWISPFGCQVIISMYWQMKSSVIAGLSLAVGIATVRALKKFNVTEAGLKWPNDIYARNRKMAGILVESRSTVYDKFHVVAGTGLNLVPAANLKSNTVNAIALNEITGGATVSRNDLVIEIIREYRRMMTEFESRGFAPLQDEWNAMDLYRGSRIRLVNKISGETIAEGIERGINRTGCILIEGSNGRLRDFSIGDVSLQL
ncbi:MAG: biotin--[Succinivibrionaceae bacterium]|nr:biotin--[acetyl-CoA-carboxylase] ligase [Succinivibrionaceae bacterium]